MRLRLAPLALTVLALSTLALAAPSFAAHVTDVADAMDEKHPLEVDLDVTYTHLRRETRITREQATTSGILLVDELHHLQTLDATEFRLGVGLWHDLELHVLAPLVLRDVQNWRYADVNGVSVEGASTLKNNHFDISGCLQQPTACDSSAAPTPIMPIPGQSQHAGLLDPTVGIAWGPVNEERELKLKPNLYPEGKPVATWVIGFDYTFPAPGGAVNDPSRFGLASGANNTVPNGAEARRAHVFTLWTAFSKRYRVLEPYAKVWASAPVAAKSAYDNCSHPELLSDVAAVNCAGAWHGETGYRPPYTGGIWLGAELVAAEDREADRRFSIDVRGEAVYHGPGRDYTQVSDALGKLTFEDEYLTTMGTLGIYGRIARWLHARVYATVGFETAHFLTHEDVGDDKTGDGQIILSGGRAAAAGRCQISGKADCPDQNPDFDFRLDQIGRRLRAEPALVWGVAGTLSLNF